jgi:hypothetical protein
MSTPSNRWLIFFHARIALDAQRFPREGYEVVLADKPGDLDQLFMVVSPILKSSPN